MKPNSIGSDHGQKKKKKQLKTEAQSDLLRYTAINNREMSHEHRCNVIDVTNNASL